MRIAMLISVSWLAVAHASSQTAPCQTEPWLITESTTLERGATIRRPIVIGADGITIDGNGAVISGEGYTGVGVRAEGRDRITLRNLTVRGYRVGLEARDGTQWRVEGCDFSANYTNPNFGWGELPPAGGLRLIEMRDCVIRHTTAKNNWNGCELVESAGNRIEFCDFSHCSNTCLKLWRSSCNLVERCDLSWGLRKRPNEVHARDSTCVLLETGSNANRFVKNDITHGGDGVFIRVLNGWVSTGNTFIENDVSYANNNGFEAWSPHNVFLRNKANHCSYGFWLGGSDHTVLIGNEASYNGLATGNHNAPEPDFGHGGIVIVNGSGHHTILDGNVCRGNNGGGIVFRGDRKTRGEEWRMQHLIVQRNTLEKNRYGIFGAFTDWIDVAANRFDGNEEDVHLDACTNVFRHDGNPPPGAAAPTARLSAFGPFPGRPVGRFSARESTSRAGHARSFRWDIDGEVSTLETVEHAFNRVGFHRIALTVTDGMLSSLAHRDVWVGPADEHPATESDASRWSGAPVVLDATGCAVRGRSLRIRPDAYDGAPLTPTLALETPTDIASLRAISFFLRWRNPNKWSFTGPNPIVRLHAEHGQVVYVPAQRGLPRALMRDPPYGEAREGWLYCEVPIAGGDEWIRRVEREGTVPFVSGRLRFETADSPLNASGPTALASDGKTLYCAILAAGELHASADGATWRPLRRAKDDLGVDPHWINGMLAYAPDVGATGSLVLAGRDPERDRFGHEVRRLCLYDIATDRWRWLPTITLMTHGAVVVGEHVLGLAHAIGGNYGGPLCRVALDGTFALDQHSVLAPVRGCNAWWFSRAAQLAVLGDHVYAIKNDWETPAPGGDAAGDRLLAFDPSDYDPSAFTGENRFDAKAWEEHRTPCTDLGRLPFEIGHGAALVALPPNWGGVVGDAGGLFIVAGNSPADHEGHGAQSDHWAIYDVAGRAFTVGRLPGVTGAGTAASLHRGEIVIKRGGTHLTTTDHQVWRVTPLSIDAARTAIERQRTRAPSFSRIRRISLAFDSWGYDPFTVWIDGLRLLPRQ